MDFLPAYAFITGKEGRRRGFVTLWGITFWRIPKSGK
jgi:hypothetical protein